jgi:vitamin B12 transporter
MHITLSRAAASLSLRERFVRRCAFTLFFLLMVAGFALPARAVVVRGRVTDASGKPLAGARVQLVQGGTVAVVVYSDADGMYEIRYADAGRFTLLGSAATYLPAVGTDFYGGATDVLEQSVVLAKDTVRQEISVTATGIPTPEPQLTSPVGAVPAEALALRLGVVNELRQEPGVFLVQAGQTGSQTSLFVRGGNSTSNLVLIDGMPADDVGGTFDFGTVSSMAVGKIEVVRGPDSAMYGTDAGASVVSITTPRGTSLRPAIDYSGDAGNLHTWRNEAAIGGTLEKLDYYGAFSRLDASNALALDRFHAQTAAINVGYDIDGNTQARFTIRNGDSVEGAPGPHDFFGISANNRQADQDLYSALTLENRYKDKWHNLLRYGIARKREQEQQFGNVGTPVTFSCGAGCSYTEYFGNVVTIRGANGYSANGQTDIYGGNTDQDSNRDQLYYQSDYSFSQHVIALFGFRYDNERGSFNFPTYFEAEKTQRTNFEYNLQFQGEFFNRLFYSAGGAVEKNHLYGIAGTPRLGLSYIPVRPGSGFLHGTRLRANAATGVQEPTLAIEEESLFTQLTAAGDSADIVKYHITPQAAERSRTYDFGIDQNIVGEKLVLKAGYFHNVFDRQLEGVDGTALNQYFGLNLPLIYEAYVNSLAFRAQGAELELNWHPTPRLLVRGGYTNLSTKVVQSFASDAVSAQQGFPTTNPNFPNIAIGAEGPLVGARPFRRAPNTGYFAAQYTRPRFSLVLKGAMASRSDDSTFLDYSDLNGGNTLLLPNHDLDFGYVKLDLGGTFVARHNIVLFTQMENLLNNQHIGPIGYPGLPFTVRAGVKLHLFGD